MMGAVSELGPEFHGCDVSTELVLFLLLVVEMADGEFRLMSGLKVERESEEE
jgi:hypothetical protein